MPSANNIRAEVNGTIRFLVDKGLADDFQFGILKQVGRRKVIAFPNSEHLSRSLDDILYAELYDVFLRARAYNVRMLDGALIQMMYEFGRREVLRHRLAFMPAPHLRYFQDDPDVYLDDELFGDVVAHGAVPFPLRYDFDARIGRHRGVMHAKSHLTLGQYPYCRIPVSAPVTPQWFIDFLLRNFYQNPSWDYAKAALPRSHSFGESITSAERGVVHVVIP